MFLMKTTSSKTNMLLILLVFIVFYNSSTTTTDVFPHSVCGEFYKKLNVRVGNGETRVVHGCVWRT